MIDILLVDDQALLCEVLKTWLNVEKDIAVVGVAHNGEEAIEQVEQLQPDIVLMDIDMPKMDGLQATKIISQRFPKVRVIFLSGHSDDVYLGKSLRAGAKGYLLKNTTAEELVKKVRSVYNNVNLLESAQNDNSLIPLQVKMEELIETYQLKLNDMLAEYDTLYSVDNSGQIEQKIEQTIEQTIEQKIEQTIEQKIEQTIEQKIEQTIEQKIEQTIEQKIEQTIEQKIEQTIEQKIEQTIEQKIEQTIEQKIEQTIEQKIEQTIEQKIGDSLNHNFEELEQRNQSSWQSVRRELINVNSQFNQANKNLSSQFERKIDTLKHDLDSKLSEALDDWSRQRAALQEWAVQRDEMRPDLDEYEVKGRQEMMSIINPMRTSLGDVDRQVKTTKSWLKISSLLGLLAIALSGYVLISQIKSGDSLIQQTETVPERNL